MCIARWLCWRNWLVARSPSQEATLTVAGKTISIKYSAPSVRGRQVFGDGGVVSHDKTYPVWRAGANRATAFHTDADLNVGGQVVPAGDYTLFVLVKDPEAWQLIINKQTGQWGLTYKEDQDLARVQNGHEQTGCAGGDAEIYSCK